MVNPDLSLTIDVDPQNKFRRYLRKVIDSVDDLSFSMGETVRILKKGSTANFILKGSGKYTPLTRKYSDRKRILAPGAPILVGAKKGSVIKGSRVSGGGISGKLRDSIIGTTPDSVIRIGKKSLDFGTKARSEKGAPYPYYVQHGTDKMASRPFLFLTARMTKQIINTIDAEITSKWKNPK